MALRRPTKEELKQLATANHCSLNDEELADFNAMIPSMFATLDKLDHGAFPVPPVKYPERDRGYRPRTEDDPLNAILRRCSVKGAGSGKLAGKRIGIKDCFAVAGILMNYGSLVTEGYVPEIDATLVTRILDAGGEIAAKLNLDNMRESLREAYDAVLQPVDALVMPTTPIKALRYEPDTSASDDHRAGMKHAGEYRSV